MSEVAGHRPTIRLDARPCAAWLEKSTGGSQIMRLTAKAWHPAFWTAGTAAFLLGTWYTAGYGSAGVVYMPVPPPPGF